MATSKSQEQIFDRNLRRLEIKVKAYFTRMQDMYDSIAKLDTADKIDTFLSKASTIDIIRSDFVRTLDERNELLASEVNAGEPNYAAMLAFEDLYASVRFKYSQLSSRPNTHNTCETKMAFHKSSPKLPRLELMSFNGELENWPIFYETFKSSIHENIELNDSEKIQYLMGKLTGKALTICQGFMPTAENYSVLWQTLINKYNDKRVLAASYFDKLLNLPSVNEDCSNSLDNFIDKYSSLISSLKQLNLDNLEDFIFIHLGSKKVGLNILKSFEMHHGTSVKLPSCSQFIDFIRNQSHILQRANNIVGTRQSSYKSVKNSTSFSTSRPNSNNYNKISKTFVIKDQNKCYCCGNTEHFQLRFCKKFNALSPTERFDFIKLNKGCVNCLSKEHTVRHCTSKSTCTQCSRSHHSLLHFTSELNREPHSKILSERITNASFATNVSSSQAAHATAASPQSISLCAINPSADVPRAQSPGHTILLGTAQCNVIDCAGNKNTVRILVDSASQRDLITLNCCWLKELGSIKLGGMFRPNMPKGFL
ncbi:uncharacterized protein LOC126975445 [Leptidea sinapis]|uniref:uncharacterized protein LOC126975445 n=1 Tax=Leptidea sinapis TaxID=189913 RepID=UPI0021C4237D|nr:uncharacterized protein LOC126975445 [Leptidea sinapis]